MNISGKWILPFWLAGCALAVWHLLYLAGYKIDLEGWLFTAFLLLCYSLPLFLLTKFPLPAERSPERLILLAMRVLIIAISLATPLVRFLPNYKSSAMEALVYIAYPVVEVGIIGVMVLIAGGIKQFGKH